MSQWLLLPEVRNRIERAIEAGKEISAETITRLRAESDGLGKMSVIGRKAVIPIEGVLTEKRDWYAAFYGGGNTLYPDIIGAVAEANENDDVDEAVLSVGYSPGGGVMGLFPVLDVIAGSTKPVKAVVTHGALSAAYGLVSQAGQIEAAGRGTQFGSIGVAMDTLVFDGEIKEVSISSTNAPKKRPDLLTEEGQAAVREELDAWEAEFAGSIAKGRKTTLKNLNKNFGQGGVVLANEALSVGMIDSIGTVETEAPKQTAQSGETEVRSMDLNQLKAEHPDVYAAAVELGVKQERDRVGAHLTLGQSSGDMKTAIEAVTNGSELTATLTATYLAAGMNKASIGAREADNPDLSGVAEPVTTGANTLEKAVAAAWDRDENPEGSVVLDG